MHPGTASRRFPSSVHRYESFRYQDSSTDIVLLANAKGELKEVTSAPKIEMKKAPAKARTTNKIQQQRSERRGR